MSFRRTIRNLLFVSLLLCIAGWPATYFYRTSLHVGSAPTLIINILNGTLKLCWADSWGMDNEFANFTVVPLNRFNHVEFLDGTWGKSYYIAGINIRVLDIPFWILATALCPAFAFAWWTCPRRVNSSPWNMKWPIRIAALTLLTLCTAAWTSSYYYNVKTASCAGRYDLDCTQDCGMLDFMWRRDSRNSKSPNVSIYLSDTITRDDYEGLAESSQHGLLFGWFSYDPDLKSKDKIVFLHVPFWFPTLLLALILTLIAFLTWRKTTAPTRAFPIEPAK